MKRSVRSTDDVLDLVGGTPRYQQVMATLLRELRAGVYPVGSLLPPEPQLRQRFGVSRSTVREAVRRLCELGLVSRHQGVGTTVRAATSGVHYVAAMSSLQDLMRYTQRTRLNLLKDQWVRADEALAQQLGCAVGDRWLELDACRIQEEDDCPFVHIKVYVRPEYRGIRSGVKQGKGWFYGLIEEHSPERIAVARQVVGAIAISKASAHILGVVPGTPGLQVRRYYFSRNRRLMSASVNIYPPDRFEFATEWKLVADRSEALHHVARQDPGAG